MSLLSSNTSCPLSFVLQNDDDICDNIKQLHNSKDFEFLDEVYAQGEAVSSPGSTGTSGTFLERASRVLIATRTFF